MPLYVPPAGQPATTPAQFCNTWVGHEKAAKTIEFYHPRSYKRPSRVDNSKVTFTAAWFLQYKRRTAGACLEGYFRLSGSTPTPPEDL